MKLRSVEAVILDFPFHYGGPPTGWGPEPWRALSTLLVRVETENGLVGFGVPTGPGLGHDPDPHLVKEYARGRTNLTS
ncbi:MAG: hypothetical protein HOI95_09860 [Chromatiales bacterium]|jgi:hypothetical protein|nr:hypothetical protein [Chromatiales bacterium]